MPSACQNATVTVVPVTPGADDPAFWPVNAARHGGEYADSVCRGELPKQRPRLGLTTVVVVVAAIACCWLPDAPAVCDAACRRDCRIVSGLSSGGAFGFSAPE